MKAITLVVVTVSLALATAARACDSDAECGAGGTCIKREARARGVCYGGDFSRPRESEPAPPALVDPLSVPLQRPQDACMMTEECPAGMECVIRGVWGECTAL